MEKNSRYKCVDYWNERYKDEEHFEWFGDYAKFRPILQQKLKQLDRVLVLGCGNSRMSEEMYLDGFRNIVNTDYSPVIIELMKKRCKSMSQMKWEVMDINELTYESESFDCVIEKGTLDALLVDEKDPWNLSEENKVKMDNICDRISKLLKHNGVFISITFAQPHFRQPIYAKHKYNWSIERFTVGETFHYFIYVMTKGQCLSDTDSQFYCRNENNNLEGFKLSLNESDENYLFQINE